MWRKDIIVSTVMFQELCDYMKIVEELHPLPLHPSYFNEWCDEILTFWISTGEPVPNELYLLLSLRKSLFEYSFQRSRQDQGQAHSSWKWLLTVDQMPQRTTDWYTQKRNMLTASEISQMWKGPKSRIALIASKVNVQEAPPKRLATLRAETNPMDWGVRYEPLVKAILERDGSSIQELGRIQHRTIPGLAASPDGLYVSGEKTGYLVEIKCPISRVISEEIPFDYWCQMQIQMEVCDIDQCEYVEAKFKEDVAEPEGYITLCMHADTDEFTYMYHDAPRCEEVLPWLCIETYSWGCISLRRSMVQRDTKWIEKMKPDIALFWQEVEDVRQGRRVLPLPKKKVIEELKYSFVD